MYGKLTCKKPLFINRGDTFITTLFINNGNELCEEQYKIKDDDIVLFYITEPHQLIEDAIIKKKYDFQSDVDLFGDLIIQLDHDDTKCLIPGTYYYSCKLISKDDNYKNIYTTLIDKSVLTLL